MILSEQKRVAQEANQNIVQIRTAEVKYFSSFFISFGTQATVIALFSSGITDLRETSCPVALQYIYWISKVIALLSAMHCLLCCVFLAVFGQGLALRGPIGSMARAVQGMAIEQNYVVAYFVLSVVMFTISALSKNWGNMPEAAAIVTTIILLSGIFLWYGRCLRIYNRFRMDQQDGAKLKFRRNTKKDPSKRNIDENITKRKNHSEYIEILRTLALGPNAQLLSSTSSMKRDIYYEGYLQTGFASKVPIEWEESYGVLVDTYLFFFHDKNSYLSSPKSPINRRPFDLDGIRIIEKSINEPYSIILEPIKASDERIPLELRFHSITNMTDWLEALNQSMSKVNNDHQSSGVSNILRNSSK